jgi:hypothetical protein
LASWVSGTFDKAEVADVAAGIAAGSDDALCSRVEGGVHPSLGHGLTLSGRGFNDGIGSDDFQAYGDSARLTVPLR